MQFKLITNEDGTKELHYRTDTGAQFDVILLGVVDTPSGPKEQFDWLTAKLKEHNVVPVDTKFILNQQ